MKSYYEENPDIYASTVTGITQAMLELHNSSAIEACKIKVLLNWDEFKIELVSNDALSQEAGDAIAAFDPGGQSILFRPSFIAESPQIFISSLSHELRHALTAAHNFKNNVSIFFKDGKRIAMPLILGKHLLQNGNDGSYMVSDQEQASIKKAFSYILQDFKRLEDLFFLMEASRAELSINQRKIVTSFIQTVKESGYQRRLIGATDIGELNSQFIDSEFDYDEISHLYRPKNDRSFVKYSDFAYITFIRKDRHYNAYVTDPGDNSPETLAKDLLFNLRLIKHHIMSTESSIFSTISEFDAYAEEFLARTPELFKKLFPSLMEIRANQGTAETEECLEKRGFSYRS